MLLCSRYGKSRRPEPLPGQDTVDDRQEEGAERAHGGGLGRRREPGQDCPERREDQEAVWLTCQS